MHIFNQFFGGGDPFGGGGSGRGQRQGGGGSLFSLHPAARPPHLTFTLCNGHSGSSIAGDEQYFQPANQQVWRLLYSKVKKRMPKPVNSQHCRVITCMHPVTPSLNPSRTGFPGGMGGGFPGGMGGGFPGGMGGGGFPGGGGSGGQVRFTMPAHVHSWQVRICMSSCKAARSG